jgi:hypothetical protein
MDIALVFISGSMIFGSLYVSINLQKNYRNILVPLSYNTHSLDCPEWFSLISGSMTTSEGLSCTLPALINRRIYRYTVDDLLIKISKTASGTDQ